MNNAPKAKTYLLEIVHPYLCAISLQAANQMTELCLTSPDAEVITSIRTDESCSTVPTYAFLR